MGRYRDQETNTSRRKQATKPPRQAVRADASAENLRRQHAIARPHEATPAVMFGLQQVIGNRALQRLIDESAQREQDRSESGELDAETQAEIQRERGGGRPLDRATAAQMSPALGDDFSGVRVHTDARADTLNRALNAKAFTLGNDVFFCKNSYRPENPTGQHLLAHELTHVSQQRGTPSPSHQAPLRVGPPTDRHEYEAEKASTRALTSAPGSSAAGGTTIAQRSGLSAAPASVQRFEAKKSKQYTRTSSKPDPPMFVAQANDPTLTKQDEIRHRIKQYQQPNLYFSDDRTIAINSTKKEAKEFYATRAVIDAANIRLHTVGSAVELEAEGGTYITEGMHKNRLLKVTPRIKARATTEFKGGDEAQFGTHICIEVAQLVCGNILASYHTEALFKGGHAERFTPGGKHAAPVNKLADYVAQVTSATLADMSVAMRKTGDREQAGEEYGKLSKDKLETVSHALGINRHAKNALVGEGYTTFSTRRPTSKGAHAWGYHYAGVVAASLDGSDQVTLENYNRSGDISKLKHKLLKQMLKKNKEVINAKVILLKRQIDAANKELLDIREKRTAATEEQKKAKERRFGDLGTKYGYLIMKKKKELKQNVGHILKEVFIAAKEAEDKTAAEGETAFRDATDSQPTKRWFFHMYGSKKGQSFHEQSAKSGYFSNPLTMKVRKQ